MYQQVSKGPAITSLILGIVSCVFPWWGTSIGAAIDTYNLSLIAVFSIIFPVICLACAIVGLVLAIKSKNALVAAGQGKGLAVAGMIVSIIGLVFSGIAVFACGCVAVCACSAGQDELTNAAYQLSQYSNLY